jgi:hypothetical protein
MYSQEQLDTFIKQKTGINQLKLTDDLCKEHGVGGDDFHKFIDAYANTFNVDMTGYLWYFHAGEEGHNIGGIIFKPPYEKVTQIPVTPAMLLDFANKGYWDVFYPPHNLPKRRWDIIFNKVLIVLVIAFVFYSCLK